MTRQERRLKAKQQAFWLGMLAGVVLSMLTGLVMNYLDAKDMLAYCKYEGWTECHIEYDMPSGFHVYWRGE